MQVPKVLAVINALAAATVLIITVTVTSVSGRLPVSAAFIAKEAKDKAPDFGLEVLARGVEDWQHRAAVLKWVCYGALPVLVANIVCWTMRQRELPAS